MDYFRNFENSKRKGSRKRGHEIEVEQIYSSVFGNEEVQMHPIAMPTTGCLKKASGREELCLDDNILLLFKDSFADSTFGSTRTHQDSFRQEIAEPFQFTSAEAGKKNQPSLLQMEGKRFCGVGAEGTQVSALRQFTDPQNIRKENIESSPLAHKNLEVTPDGLDFEFRFNRDFLEEDSYCSWESV